MDPTIDTGHGHVRPESQLPGVAWGLILFVGIVIAGAWIVTWRTAAEYEELLMRQVAGTSPADTIQYVLLSGTMMVAMMLPSALPMIAVFRGLTVQQSGVADARLRTALFSLGYLLVWTVFTAAGLIALLGLGLMGTMNDSFRFVPGILLVAAGGYQLTAWKQFCLRQCRTPMGFLMTRWRSGRGAAARMGLEHAGYCLGCCWLLMIVLFVAGAMSVLWMGVFAGLVLAEKVGSGGEGFSRLMGGVGIGVGLLALSAAWFGPM